MSGVGDPDALRLWLRVTGDRALVPFSRRFGWYPYRTIRHGPGKGLRMSLRNASADYTLGRNEVPVQEALVANLAPESVFYDIGSNVGFFSLLAARRVGRGGRVYAFEPVPDNAHQARSNAARNGFSNIEVLSFAVSDRCGSAWLEMSDHPGGASIIGPNGAEAGKGFHVTICSIDQLVDGGRLRPPTLVKIDVEGLEFQVLRGMAGTLRTYAPTVICELDGPTASAVRPRRERLESTMDELGYELAVLPPSYCGTGWEVLHAVARPVRPRP